MDISGAQFGKLKAVRRDADRRTKGGNVLFRWVCLCSCGKEKTVLQSSLIQGKTKSCGCLLMEAAREKGLRNRKHGGYSLFSSANERIKYQALVNIRERSRRNGYESDLEVSDLPELTDTCPVLGIRYQKGSLKDKDASPSIDRKNPNLPYKRAYKDNLVFVSHRANRIKSNASLQELEKIVKYMGSL